MSEIFNYGSWQKTLASLQSSVGAVDANRKQALRSVASLVSVLYSFHGPDGFMAYFWSSPDFETVRGWLDPQINYKPVAGASHQLAYLQTLLTLGGSTSEEIAKLS